MRRLLISFFVFLPALAGAQVATGISAQYHDGQIFVTWHNIPACDSGFYYVYSNDVPITASNFSSSQYLGCVPFNFSYDYRYSASRMDHASRYLVINDNPRQQLRPDQNVFILTCTQENQAHYFAIRCDYGKSAPNWQVVPGINATEEGFPIREHLDPVRAYLQESGVEFPGSPNGELMDVYIHYGTADGYANYPAMANEGCLVFHFGIVKEGEVGANNRCFLKFHGGNGNFISNAITSLMDSTWKISFDDWIPDFKFSSTGYNTRWLGYSEHFNVFKASINDAPPVDGIIKAYTLRRIDWELRWIMGNWPNTIDSDRIYMVGTSQGCGGVWLQAITQPWLYAAANATDGKLNLNAANDDNPGCNYNDTSAGRKETRVLWGNEDETNLPTDVPVIDSPGLYYRIYDLTDIGYMLGALQNYSLPLMRVLNGKEDENTCWEEKIGVYNSVNAYHSGGMYYWDLRTHGGGNNEWPSLNVPYLMRYRADLSYPAFSNCTGNGDPGDSSGNTLPPYYDGDTIGAINGTVDWYDSTVVESDTSWQAVLYTFQAQLLSGTLYPDPAPTYVTADVTIRRPQKFINLAPGSALCWTNTWNGGSQSGTVYVTYNGSMELPVTIPGIKIYPSGSTLKVQICQ